MNIVHEKMFVQTYIPNYGYCYLRSKQLDNTEANKVIQIVNQLRKNYMSTELEKLKQLLQKEFQCKLICSVKNLPDPDYATRNFEQVIVVFGSNNSDLLDIVTLPNSINNLEETSFSMVQSVEHSNDNHLGLKSKLIYTMFVVFSIGLSIFFYLQITNDVNKEKPEERQREDNKLKMQINKLLIQNFGKENVISLEPKVEKINDLSQLNALKELIITKDISKVEKFLRKLKD